MKRSTLLETIDVGKTIKRLREERGLSQEELAKDICDRTNITKLENGHSKIPSLSFILLICDKLEITIQEFLNVATNNHYCLDRELILDLLMHRNYKDLKTFISNIDSELLFNRDKRYYIYLKSIIEIDNNNVSNANKLLNTLLNNHPEKDFICPLAKQTLNLMNGKELEIGFEKFNNENEMLYLIDLSFNHHYNNGNIKKATDDLAKEIYFINLNGLNKYLEIYYKNRIKLVKNDFKKEKELENKIVSITKINK